MDIAWLSNIWLSEEFAYNLVNNLGGFLSSETINIFNYLFVNNDNIYAGN